MVFKIFKGLFRIFVCIAVSAAVKTGVIGSDISAFYTVTSFTHSLVLEASEGDIVCLT